VEGSESAVEEVIGRRHALSLLGAAVAIGACRPPGSALPEAAPAPALRLDPLVDLVPAAGLLWLLEARIEELLASPSTAAAVALVLPSRRFDTFAERHGGVDLRRVASLVVADYPEATLALASTPVQAARVEAAFAARAVDVEGRAVEGGVTRLWGSVGTERQQIGLFDGKAVALERGRLGPLRASRVSEIMAY
jgi:hypothetical protein